MTWYVGGKRFRELTDCWKERDALAALERKETDYWRQQELGIKRDIGGTLQAAAEAFAREHAGSSKNYRKQIGTSLSALQDAMGREQLVQMVTAADIARFKEDGLAVLASSTVRSYMLIVRRLFAYLHQEGWIRRNPALKVKLPPAQGRTDHLRPGEVGPVLEAFWGISPEIAPIATTLALGGWRKGEIVNLRREDADLTDRWAYVLDFGGDELTEEWRVKTSNSVRAVPLHRLVVRALERVEVVMRPDGTDSPWMFPVVDRRKRVRRRDRLGRQQFAHGDRRSPNTTFFGPKLREALKAAGIDRPVTVHGLRRTFAVLLQEAGAPDSVIRQALGHGARGVTDIHYLPRRDETIQRWVDKIDVQVPELYDAPGPSATSPMISTSRPVSRPAQPPPPPPTATTPRAIDRAADRAPQSAPARAADSPVDRQAESEARRAPAWAPWL